MTAEVHASANATDDDREGRPPVWFSLTAAGVVGFAFFLMEMTWFRMLGPILGGTVFTFGLILAVALFGIGLGGFLYASRSETKQATVHGLVLTCLLEAIAIAVPFAFGDRIAFAAVGLRGGLVLPVVGGAFALLLLTAEGPPAAWRHSGIGAGRAVALPDPAVAKGFAASARRLVKWEREGVESSVALLTINGLAFAVNG